MLTERKIQTTKAKEKQYKLFDGGGLYLLVHPNGSKYWRLKYRFDGKEKSPLAIGVYGDGSNGTVTIREARDARDDAKRLLREGKDPAAEKKSEQRARQYASANTFEAVAREFAETKKNVWSPDHMETVLTSLEQNAFPEIGRKPIKDIKRAEVLQMLRKIEKRGALDIARRVCQRCNDVFEYACNTDRCESNPAAGLCKSLTAMSSKHFASLKKEELHEFLKKAKNYNGKPVTKAATRLLMLTFVRTSEFRFAKWPEFDLDGAEWIVPSERMKGKRTKKDKGEIPSHVVPLSGQAVDELRALHKITGDNHEGYVFPNPRGKGCMSENLVLQMIYKMGYKGKMTGHGFRSLASTILNEAGWNPDAIERQLAHINKDKVRAAYNNAQYMDERRRMMQWWGDYIEGVENGAKVIPFRAAVQ